MFQLEQTGHDWHKYISRFYFCQPIRWNSRLLWTSFSWLFRSSAGFWPALPFPTRCPSSPPSPSSRSPASPSPSQKAPENKFLIFGELFPLSVNRDLYLSAFNYCSNHYHAASQTWMQNMFTQTEDYVQNTFDSQNIYICYAHKKTHVLTLRIVSRSVSISAVWISSSTRTAELKMKKIMLWYLR